MKSIKFISALSLATLLAACSTASDVASTVSEGVSNAASATTNAVKEGATAVSNGVSNTVNTVKNKLTASSKTVVYQCQNSKTVVATYDFEGEKATGLTLTVNDVAVKELMRDEKNKDFASFASKTHVWNLDETFSLSTFNKTEAGMLFKKGKNADEILAKNCEVNQTATAKLNK
ncbi:Uncharacterised protein [Actinobacillus ureae]|uniref:hypothetical protein n=1 Tax=Actinobacillus ureae TaxID=723 RepID=UPI000E15DBBB|nr:hypothetical protein [Actinobacillus ureae]SUT87121.1 Uncharacterised protein [Actinobacillus ureae]SUU47991.1 Uncharacterised protein [Actinobacillus ureae]